MAANTSVVYVLFNQQKRIAPNFAHKARPFQDKQKRRFSVIL